MTAHGLVIRGLVALVVAASIAPRAEAGGYQRSGVYLDMLKRVSILEGPAGAGGPHKIDCCNRGLLALELRPDHPDYGKWVIHSATEDALYGLWEFSQYAHGGGRRHLRKARWAAKWLELKQRRDGTYPYQLEYEVAPGLELKEGWSGSLAQGLAASLLSRLYRTTGDRRFLEQAKRALLPLSRSFEDGGHQSSFLDTKYVFFEGYGGLPYPVHTLEHHLFTLVGLYDMRDLSSRARRLWKRGRRAAAFALPFYDIPGDSLGRTAPWLAHRRDPNIPIYALQGYFQEHEVALLRMLAQVTGWARFRQYANRYERALEEICQDPGQLCIFRHGSFQPAG